MKTKKTLVALTIFTVTLLTLTGCTADKRKTAETWAETVENQPGVLDVVLLSSTPLPFTYQVSFEMYVTPDVSKYENISNVMCETSPTLNKDNPVDINVTDSLDIYATTVAYSNHGKCTPIPTEAAAHWTNINENFPGSQLEVLDNTDRYEITSDQTKPLLSNLVTYIKNDAENYRDTFTFKTSYVREQGQKPVPFNFKGTREEFAQTSDILNHLTSSPYSAAAVTAENSQVTIDYSVEVTEEQVEEEQTLINSKNFALPVTANTSTAVNPGNQASTSTVELATKVAIEYADTTLRYHAGESGLAFFVNTVEEGKEVINYTAQQNVKNVPIRLNVEGQPINFENYFTATPENNEFTHMFQDYETLNNTGLVKFVTFDGTAIKVRANSDMVKGDIGYRDLTLLSKEIIKTGNYTRYTITVDWEDIELI